MVELIRGELDLSKQKNNVHAAGDKWLQGLTDHQRRAVLGSKGLTEWENGADWRKYLRNWQTPGAVQTRLTSLQEYKPVELSEET